MLEETAEYFSRRDGISGVCLRLPAVRDPDDAARARFFANSGQAYQEILALPDAERRERVAAIWAQCEENRASGNPAPNLPPSRSGLSPRDGWSRG
jgi:hypothetical protein